MENCFIMLNLSFDPIETNEKIINTAINEKVQQWQNESKNPRKAIIAKEKLAFVPEIKKIMFNDKLRREEANKAMEQKNKILKDIYYEILIKSSKGTILTKEINEIFENYKSYGITKNDIMTQVNVPIDKEVTQNTKKFETIDANTISQLETYFANLSIDDMSLYTFLNANFTDSLENLLSMAEKKLQFLLQKGEKTTIDEMEQKIAGIAKNIFSSKELKEKYDNYLTGSRYIRLNHLLKDGIASNGNRLNTNLYKLILDIMEKEYNINKEKAMEYINSYCRIHNIEINPEIISELLLQQDKPLPKPLEPIEVITPIIQETIPPSVTSPRNIDDEFKKLVKPLEEKLNIFYKNFTEYEKEVNHYESEYLKFDRMPNMITIIFYLIILSISLFVNVVFLISFNTSMQEYIKLFIMITSLIILVDGIYNFIYFKHTKNFYKYKKLMKSGMMQFDNLVKNKFNNHNITKYDVELNYQKVEKYFYNVSAECEELHRITYNFKVSTMNTLCKFNSVPKCGFMLGKRILTVISIIAGFYFIILKFFPTFL